MFEVITRCPASPRSHGDTCASEAVGDGLCVDPELLADVGKRSSGCELLCRFLESPVAPCRLFADGGACLAGLNEIDDGGGGEASLGRV